MRKLKSILLLVGLLSFFAISTVAASPDPLSNIRVIPVGSTHTGKALVTSSPADLIIFVTTAAHSPTKNVWLIIVLDTITYNALDDITAVGTGISVTFDKSRFMLVTTAKIPPVDADGAYDPTYPGCGKEEQYEVSAVESQMGITGDVYYAYMFFKDSITTTAYEFTLTVNLASPAPTIRALVLANGRAVPVDGEYYGLPFDMKTPFSGSTLVVPELASILLMVGLFSGAFGLYAIRRKK